MTSTSIPGTGMTWTSLLNGETVETEDALRAQLEEIDFCKMTKRAQSRIDAGDRKATRRGAGGFGSTGVA